VAVIAPRDPSVGAEPFDYLAVIPPRNSSAGRGPIDYLLVVAVGVAVAAVWLELASTVGATVAAVGVA
jgi:hypothetical protein